MSQQSEEMYDDLIGAPTSAPAIVNVQSGEMAATSYEAAEFNSMEMALWDAPMRSADGEILPEKTTIDPRIREMARNDALVRGAIQTQKDSIVGERFLLNSKPNTAVLGLDETWAEEFQEEVEAKFTLFAESIKNYPDVQRKGTLTDLVRLAVGIYAVAGEVLASVEWLPTLGRPYSTALQMIELDRLSNPNGQMDSRLLRGGVQRDRFGAAVGYWIRNSHPSEIYIDNDTYGWTYVPAERAAPRGRLNMIHIADYTRADQTRGVSGIASALKEMRMVKKFRDINLQGAALRATYAASIESELPTDVVMAQAGGGDTKALTDFARTYLGDIAKYTRGARNLTIDGVKIPHFYPGTKLNLMNAGAPAGQGDNFEASMLRYLSAALGISYEQMSRDYSSANYSNLRAALAETQKRMRVEKRNVADRFASNYYRLWLEEAIMKGDITSMPRNAPSWYQGMNADAYSECSWIGANSGQIDELKETQAAVLRMNNGLGTMEDELASLGMDWRVVLKQIAREDALKKKLGVTLGVDKTTQNTLNATSATPSSTGASPRGTDKGEEKDE